MVLVNEWTNSGAEMAAQFAKDTELATLIGGIWAQLDIRHQYDEEQKGKSSPIWIDSLKPKLRHRYRVPKSLAAAAALQVTESVAPEIST